MPSPAPVEIVTVVLIRVQTIAFLVDNNITNVDDNLKLLIERNGVETYFAAMMFAARIVHWIVSRCVPKYCWSRRAQMMGTATLIVARRSVN